MILYARGRVNAIQARTIPVLELLAAELGVIVARETACALDMHLGDVFFFVDSTVVLNWICQPAQDLTAHVTRKVAQIREATTEGNWYHIATELNPADLLSRGVDLDHLIGSNLWWEGPPFLKESAENWPAHSVPVKANIPLPAGDMFEQMIGIFVASGRPWPTASASPFKTCSTWHRALRVADFIATNLERAAVRLRKKLVEHTPRLSGVNKAAALALEQGALWPNEVAALRNGHSRHSRPSTPGERTTWPAVRASLSSGAERAASGRRYWGAPRTSCGSGLSMCTSTG